MTRIIGLTGYAGVGKDTAANVLVHEFGAYRIAIADPIKVAVTKLNPAVSRLHTVQSLLSRAGWTGQVDAQDPTFLPAWDTVKRTSPEARRLLQVFGVEVGRHMFGEDVWLRKMLRDASDYFSRGGMVVVVPDVRFHDEAVAINRNNGFVVNINRAGVGPANAHSTEAGLAAGQAIWSIDNTGTKRDFERAVGNRFGSIMARP